MIKGIVGLYESARFKESSAKKEIKHKKSKTYLLLLPNTQHKYLTHIFINCKTRADYRSK